MSRQPDRPNPPVPDEVCGEIGKQLQLTLVELIALSGVQRELEDQLWMLRSQLAD